MTDPALIPAGHHGMVWLFKVAPGLTDPVAALGVVGIDSAGTEILDLETLAAYGLARYLTEAAGFDAGQVETDRDRLDALRGTALLVFSRALPAGPDRFVAGPGLELIARFGTAPGQPDLTPLSSDSARGVLSPKTKAPMSDARIGGMVAMAVLALMFLFVVFIIVSAG